MKKSPFACAAILALVLSLGGCVWYGPGYGYGHGGYYGGWHGGGYYGGGWHGGGQWH